MQYNQSINDVVAQAHDIALNHGFYEDIDAEMGYLVKQNMQAQRVAAERYFVMAQLALVGTEVSETVQVIRKRGVHHSDVAEELADIVIRVCDLAGYLDVDLGREVYQKMRINAARPRLHGKLC